MGRAIFLVTNNRMTNECQLGPNLVGSASFGLHAEETISSFRPNTLVSEFGLSSIRLVRIDCRRLSVIPRSPEPVPKHARRWSGNAFDYRLVALSNCAFSELRAESRCGFGCTRQKQHAAHGPIQPMYQPKEHIPCLVVATSEPPATDVKNGIVPSSRTLTQQSGWLEYAQEVIVFVQDEKLRGRLVH